MNITVAQLCRAVNGVFVQQGRAQTIKGVSINSRTAKSSDVFFAIKGERFDGHDFIDQAIERKVKVIIVHEYMELLYGKKNAGFDQITVICVNDTIQALGELAAWWRRQFKIPVIGITGSAGKTTTRAMIEAVLKTKYKVLAPQGSFNNQIGVPLTLFKLNEKHDVAIIEIGTNQKNDINILGQIVKPTIAVLTNIGESHLEGLGTIKGVLKEKLSLLRHCNSKSVVIYNRDDVLLFQNLGNSEYKTMSYGIENAADIKADQISVSAKETFFRVKQWLIQLKIPAYAYVYNAMAALCCAKTLGVSLHDASFALSKVRFLKQRQRIIRFNGAIIIDDSYNANPVSMRSALMTLALMPCRGRRIVVVGDMMELGKRSEKCHRDIGKLINQISVDVVIGIGQETAYLLGELKKGGIYYQKNDPILITQYLVSQVQRGDLVLIKGSRGMKMEEIITGIRNSKRG